MTDEEKLEESFCETLGLGPSKRYRKKFSKYSHRQKMAFYHRKYSALPQARKEELMNRGKAHTIVNNELIEANERRLEKMQGTYPAKHHVFNRKNRDSSGRHRLGFDDFHRGFVAEFGRKPIQTTLEDAGALREIWSGRTVLVVRDNKGRLKRWVRV